jgi:hypothetical protein
MSGTRNIVVVASVLGVVLLGSAPGVGASAVGAAKTFAVRAAMDPGQVVTPANKRWLVPARVRDARGSFAGTLDIASGRRLLSWRVAYANVGASHLPIVDVHLGKPGHFGQLLARLCAPCTSGQHGTKTLTRAAATAIASGNAWVTLITERYPNGVIRGQVRATGR